jgi:molecular chaperone GrpE
MTPYSGQVWRFTARLDKRRLFLIVAQIFRPGPDTGIRTFLTQHNQENGGTVSTEFVNDSPAAATGEPAAPEETIQAENAAAAEAVEEKRQLLAAQEEAAQQKDKLLRLAAEFENYKKRMERERLTSLKYAGEYIMKEMLSVVDNLERAIAAGQAEGASAEANLNALSEGLRLTHKNLIASLEKFEVKGIDSIGKPFDPNIHEAMTMEESDQVAASHVLKEYEKGYFFKDRLLRPAKVIVSAGKKSTSAGA